MILDRTCGSLLCILIVDTLVEFGACCSLVLGVVDEADSVALKRQATSVPLLYFVVVRIILVRSWIVVTLVLLCDVVCNRLSLCLVYLRFLLIDHVACDLVMCWWDELLGLHSIIEVSRAFAFHDVFHLRFIKSVCVGTLVSFDAELFPLVQVVVHKLLSSHAYLT